MPPERVVVWKAVQKHYGLAFASGIYKVELQAVGTDATACTSRGRDVDAATRVLDVAGISS